MSKSKTKPKASMASNEDLTFWYVKVPMELLLAANAKRGAAKASKTGVVVRMLQWYLQDEIAA